MAEVIFFEKPGCINNTRQKRWLEASGHRVIARNLLVEQWSARQLRPFFGVLPVREWFNPTAPAVVNGAVLPEQLNEQEAIAVMLADPILIRRPLMQANGERRVGFAPATVRRWIGLSDVDLGDVESCPRQSTPTDTEAKK